ncbi:SLC13 family permease [bacterium]|nr:SLC13 family permease [bacterium]
MSVEIAITLGTVVAIFGALTLTRLAPDLILLGGLTVLLALRIVDPQQALTGFANQGMITVGVLFVVAAGMRETGGVWYLVNGLLGRPKSLPAAQVRMMAPVAFFSGFLNNTPIVAMMMPAVMDWAKKLRLPVSKLLIPLSYAAILGGLCTLIGTSTNLVVNGLLIEQTGESLGMFTITKIGLPIAIIGFCFMLLLSRWLLPDRQPPVSALDDPRQYVLEMLVEHGSPVIGKTIEQAGLRHLPNMFLMEIERKGRTIPAVAPVEVLEEGDRLFFVGVVDSVLELQKIPGLKPATNQLFKLSGHSRERILVEAVISHTSPLIGQSVREGRFRTHYNAVVIAVARNGERIRKKIGDIILKPGDTLLLEALPSFMDQRRHSLDFYLVSRVEGYTPPRHERSWLAFGILGAMVLSVTVGFFSMLEASLLAAAAMLLTGCTSMDNARQNIEWSVLLAIAAAFGIGQAIDASGTADLVADFMIKLGGSSPWLTMIAIYVLTAVFTELLTNNAAAVLVFPIAMAAAERLGVSHMPFVMAIIVAASASFITPIGYQTNLMVFGPGGYRFSDFIKIGVPLALGVGALAIVLIPFWWAF